MRRLFPTLIIALLAFGLGVMAFGWYHSRQQDELVREEATVLLERVRNVLKLVTVEGDVNELFSSTTSRKYTLYLPLPSQFSFDKKATVEVTGKVLVGYDLEQLDLAVDPDRRVLTVRNLPEPEILAIDHELVYRDLNESWFNSFTAEDYSKLNRRAKERLRDEALRSELIDRAREQGASVIEGIEYLAGSAGYTVVVEPSVGRPRG